MDARLHLRCLGEPVLSGPNGEPIRFKVKKHLALLVFLTVESRVRHHRDALADLLWANLPGNDGRHSLATALSMIRAKVGGDVVEADRDHVRFACMRMDLDLHRLEGGDVLASDYQPALEIAGFLDGFEVPGAEFMLWRERQRARWLPLVREALVARIDKCRRTGDFKQIEHLADRMLDLDELSEDAVRAKMEARAFAGDRLTALKVFEAWRERLDEDLSAEPSSMVEGMAIRLRRRGWERPSGSPVAPVSTDQWKNRPFVGRALEYQTLYEGWERTRRGEPGHTVLLGDSGIGKSTLADRLATAASLEGAITTRVQCYDVEREIPYAAISGLVQGLIDLPGASATPPTALAELARTVPAVRHRFPSVPPAGESQGETARILLTEAFHHLLSALAEEQPVIVIVDDLHHADDASLAVLHLLIRRVRGQQVMVIFATRMDGMDQSPQAQRLREGARSLGIQTIELARMSPTESASLLASFIEDDDEQPSAATRKALLRAAAGYPMILELLLKDWQLNGEHSLALSIEAMTVDPVTGNEPIEAYRQILDRITHGLDSATRNVLNLASILGNRLNDVDRYVVADLSIGQTMSGMTQLVRLRILRERSGGGLEFVNELVRAHAYVSVPSPLRRAVHGRLAAQLLSDATAGRPHSGLEIAWHCFRSGRPKQAVPYLLSGAKQALDDGAPHEVELALASALPSLSSEEATEAGLLITAAMQEQGRWVDSLRMTDHVRRTGGGASSSMLKILELTAHFNLRDIGGDNLPRTLDQLESIIKEPGSIDLRIRALFVAALLLDDVRRPDLILHFLKYADQIGTPVDDTEAALKFIIARSMLISRLGRRDPDFADLEAMIARFADTSVANLAAVHLFHCSSALRCATGRYEQAVEHGTLAYRMAVRLGNDVAIASAAGNVALCSGRLGDYDDQLRWASTAQSHLGAQFTGFRDIQIGFSLAFGNVMSRNVPAALNALMCTHDRIPPTAPAWMHQAWSLWRSDVLQLAGRRAEALEVAESALVTKRLETVALAGPFARWSVLSSRSDDERNFIRVQLKKMKEQLSTYDTLDQAEILAAICWVDEGRIDRGSEARCSANQSRLSSKLLELPPAIGGQLMRLKGF